MVHKSPIRSALQFLNMVFFAINFLFVKKKSIYFCLLKICYCSMSLYIALYLKKINIV